MWRWGIASCSWLAGLSAYRDILRGGWWLVEYKELVNWLEGPNTASMAKIRLHAVVAQDRKACGDGKWVEQAIYIIDLHPFSMTTYNEDTHGPLNRKRVYRWQWRH